MTVYIATSEQFFSCNWRIAKLKRKGVAYLTIGNTLIFSPCKTIQSCRRLQAHGSEMLKLSLEYKFNKRHKLAVKH
jgi:hypothetical protein